MTKKVKIVFLFLFMGLGLISCRDTDSGKRDQASIHFSNNLIISDVRFLRVLDEWIKKVGPSNKKHKFVYQITIGRYNKGFANVTLSVLSRISHLLEEKAPIGYMKYKGKFFWIYSAISDYCKPDPKVLDALGNLSEHLHDDVSPGWDTMEANRDLGSYFWDPPLWLVKYSADTIIVKSTAPTNLINWKKYSLLVDSTE